MFVRDHPIDHSVRLYTPGFDVEIVELQLTG
jgi:hypothetical protein